MGERWVAALGRIRVEANCYEYLDFRQQLLQLVRFKHETDSSGLAQGLIDCQLRS